MSHPNVVYVGSPDGHHYNTWQGAGWYFADPTDHLRLNIQGPYATEEAAEKEYFAYCEAAVTLDRVTVEPEPKKE